MGPAFHRDFTVLRTSHGGYGFRPTKRCALFLNAMVCVIPQTMGTDAAQWNSLRKVLRIGSFKRENIEKYWGVFLSSGSAWGKEFESEIARVKALRNAALSAAQRPHPPPANKVFDTSNIDFGFGIETACAPD